MFPCTPPDGVEEMVLVHFTQNMIAGGIASCLGQNRQLKGRISYVLFVKEGGHPGHPNDSEMEPMRGGESPNL